MIGLEKLRKRNDGICKKIIWVIIFLLVISTIVLVQNLRGKMKGELYGGADGYKIYYDQDLNTYAYQIFSLEGEGEPKPELSLAPVAKRLSEKLGKEVVFAKDDTVVGENAKKAVSEMKDGDVVLLENTRYRKEETKNEDKIGRAHV